MARRLGFGIFPKLLLTMLVVTLIPLGAIWYLDYRTESENLSNQIEQRLSGQADTMVGYVDAWVDMHLRMLRQNAALEDMAAMDGKKQKPLLRAIAAEFRDKINLTTRPQRQAPPDRREQLDRVLR